MLQVLLINCEDTDGDARDKCNELENGTFSLKELEESLEGFTFMLYEDMSDFMEGFNNEEIPYTSHFLTYLRIKNND